MNPFKVFGVKKIMMLIPKFVLPLILAMACPKNGTISGHVKIGPISPVQRVGEEEVVPPEMYKEYKIVLISGDGKKEIGRYKIDGKGNYKIVVPAGDYRIIWDGPAGRMLKLGTKNIKVKEGKTTKMDFDIDTGIR